MVVPVLTAVTGARWETDLVSSLEHSPIDLSVVRRCVDLPDLLAAATSGQASAVVLSADLRRLDRDAVARLRAAGVAVIGVVNPGDDAAAERLNALGVHQVVPADASPDVLAAAVATAIDAVRSASGDDSAADHVVADPGADLPRQELRDQLPEPPPIPPGSGKLVAVWGPTGAPGRTSLAVNLASEAAELGVRALLADADAYGGVVAQSLGLLEEAPGLAAACRAANAGRLTTDGLLRHTRAITDRLLVLTGISRPERWVELRASALDVVWHDARSVAELTVADVGFCLEQDEELSFDTAAPRRNGATLVTLAQADTVLAVGSADPIGLQRLVRGLSQLRETIPGIDPVVVVNGVRKAPVGGGNPERQIRQALRRHAGVDEVVTVPYDRAAYDAALAQGRALFEVAPHSGARQAIRELAGRLAGVATESKRTRRKRERQARSVLQPEPGVDAAPSPKAS